MVNRREEGDTEYSAKDIQVFDSETGSERISCLEINLRMTSPSDWLSCVHGQRGVTYLLKVIRFSKIVCTYFAGIETAQQVLCQRIDHL